MGPWRARVARHPVPHRGAGAVSGAVDPWRAHRRLPAPSGWHAASPAAPRVPHNAEAWLPPARRLALADDRRDPRPQRGATAVEPGTWRPAASREPAPRRWVEEDRGQRAPGQGRETAPPRARASPAALASGPGPGCLAAAKPHRPWAAGAERVQPPRPSSPALARVREGPACEPNGRAGAGRHLWPRAGPVAPPSRSQGASGVPGPPTPQGRGGRGAAPRGSPHARGCSPSPRPAGRRGVRPPGLGSAPASRPSSAPRGSAAPLAPDRGRGAPCAPPARGGRRGSGSTPGRPPSAVACGPPHRAGRDEMPAESHPVRDGGWRASGLARLEAAPGRWLTAQGGLLEPRGGGGTSTVSPERLTGLMSCGPI
jgi:hypothetical protein